MSKRMCETVTFYRFLLRFRYFFSIVLLGMIYRPVTSLEVTSLLDVFLQNSDLGLEVASELLYRDRIALNHLIKYKDDMTLLIPTDEAWKNHSQWLSSILSNNLLRQKLAVNTLGTTQTKIVQVKGMNGLILSTPSINYVIFPRKKDIEESLSKICLLKTLVPEPHIVDKEPSCSNIVRAVSFNRGIVLFVNDIVLPDSMERSLSYNSSNTRSSRDFTRA